jgi:sugar phosphate isomerase/epimerase
MDENLYIHVPFELLLHKFDLIQRVGVNVEMLFCGDTLDTLQDRDLDRVKGWLKKNNLLCTIHAPFRDMSPGGADAKVRRVTLERYLSVIRIARELKSRCVVIHPGYDDIHEDKSEKKRWLTNSVRTWEEMLKHSGNLVFCLENIFQTHPATILSLIKALDSPQVGHCFDTGHFHLFAVCALEEWFDKLGPYIREVHLHDNHGVTDDHLAIGEGQIDFERVFRLLAKQAVTPEFVLEAHSEEQALLAVKRMKRWPALRKNGSSAFCPN